MKNLIKTVIKSGMKFILSLYLIKIFIGEYFNIFRKKYLYRDVEFEDHQEKEIQHLWKKNYGKKISTRWHRLYQSYNGAYNKRYFPEIIFTTKLERKMNDREIAKIISDKSLYPIYYKDIDNVRLPDTYLINNSGIYYSGNRNIITHEAAVEILDDIGECIIKPTMDSSSGDSVHLFNFKEGIDLYSGKTVAEIFEGYNQNFIAQERIIPSSKMSELYPHSVNTLRVITYLIDDGVDHAPVTLSMGRAGNHVDNIQAGGVSVAVSDDGELSREGYTHFKEIYHYHPDTGTVFEDLKLSKVPEVIRAAKEMHEKTPHMRIISWDFTIDSNEEIVLLEINIFGQSVWFPQMVSGKPIFGDNTEKMIRLSK